MTIAVAQFSKIDFAKAQSIQTKQTTRSFNSDSKFMQPVRNE
ncbi:MAG TPA: hypothetical protein VLH08_21285 [Acidobacteriota bacterium]|nr:hypothetical protein [Acidobacteriota bacterium]